MSGHDLISISSLHVENLIAKLNEPDFVNYIKSFDIFCALETFTSSQFDFSTHFEDYSVFHAPAKNYLDGFVSPVVLRYWFAKVLCSLLRVSNAIMII